MYLILMYASYSISNYHKTPYVSTVSLKELQCFLYEVPQVVLFPLAVVDLIPRVDVTVLKQVEDREDLPVVRHQCFSDHLATLY